MRGRGLGRARSEQGRAGPLRPQCPPRSAHQKPVLLQKGCRGRSARAASTRTRCGTSAAARDAARSASSAARGRGGRMAGAQGTQAPGTGAPQSQETHPALRAPGAAVRAPRPAPRPPVPPPGRAPRDRRHGAGPRQKLAGRGSGGPRAVGGAGAVGVERGCGRGAAGRGKQEAWAGSGGRRPWRRARGGGRGAAWRGGELPQPRNLERFYKAVGSAQLPSGCHPPPQSRAPSRQFAPLRSLPRRADCGDWAALGKRSAFRRSSENRRLLMLRKVGSRAGKYPNARARRLLGGRWSEVGHIWKVDWWLLGIWLEQRADVTFSERRAVVKQRGWSGG